MAIWTHNLQVATNASLTIKKEKKKKKKNNYKSQAWMYIMIYLIRSIISRMHCKLQCNYVSHNILILSSSLFLVGSQNCLSVNAKEEILTKVIQEMFFFFSRADKYPLLGQTYKLGSLHCLDALVSTLSELKDYVFICGQKIGSKHRYNCIKCKVKKMKWMKERDFLLSRLCVFVILLFCVIRKQKSSLPHLV